MQHRAFVTLMCCDNDVFEMGQHCLNVLINPYKSHI